MPAGAAALFLALGCECVHSSDLNMQRAADEEILRLSDARQSVIITLDSDFHTIIAVNSLTTPSVVRLRREGCRAEALVEILHPVLVSHSAEILAGTVISVQDRRVACHRLP